MAVRRSYTTVAALRTAQLKAAGHYASLTAGSRAHKQATTEIYIGTNLFWNNYPVRNSPFALSFRQMHRQARGNFHCVVLKHRPTRTAPAGELPHTCAGHVIGDGVAGDR